MATRPDASAGPSPDAPTIEFRTGAGEVVLLRFVRIDRHLYVVPSPATAIWAAEALRAGGGSLRSVGGSWQACRARLVVHEAEARGARVAIRAKYGRAVWHRYFANTSRILALEPGTAPAGSTPGARIQEEFDAVAAEYHAGIDRKPFERYLKARSTSELLSRLRGLDPLLEIGAGTGWETVPLLEAGHTVVAVDISPRMLAELQRRAVSHGVADRLETVLGRLGELAPALAPWGDDAFAAAYSTFGPFNLEEDLTTAVPALARTIRPSGRLLFTTLNRPGFVPVLWEVARTNPRGALARFGRRVPAPMIRYPLDVFPRRATDVRTGFAPWFRLRSVDPISVLTPPFESARLRTLLGPSARVAAERIDRWLTSLPGSGYAAEWNLVDLEKADTADPPRG